MRKFQGNRVNDDVIRVFREAYFDRVTLNAFTQE